MNSQVHAYILAGGHSSRFGSDKARVFVHGQPLIARLAQSLASDGVSVTVVAQQVDAYQDLGLRTIADYEAHHGPLAGLLRALEDLTERMEKNSKSCSDGCEENVRALVLSCDILQWEPVWLTALLSAMHLGSLATAFRTDRWQPFPGLYNPRLLDTIRKRTKLGKGSMHGFLDDPDCDSIAVELGELPQIRSFNTQDEFRRLLSEI